MPTPSELTPSATTTTTTTSTSYTVSSPLDIFDEYVLNDEISSPSSEIYFENTTSDFDVDNHTTTSSSTWDDLEWSTLGSHANWWGLLALLVVLFTVFGNILLILAISWDRRLQNMTNYFLLSLAVTDLMVASLVMPLSIVVLVLGRFPFSSELCLLWISLDVLFCTASIMHLCTLSVDRFLSLRYPMKFGRHKTRRRVVLKIVLVWCLSLAASLPLSLMYATDPHSTIVDGVCQIPVSLFQIIASVICFYIPLIIMLVTYALTVRLLSKKQSELRNSVLEPSSATASPRSLPWKKLLCKTTSNLSTSTAVSLTDGDISEGGCALENRCEEGKLRRFGSSPLRRPPLVRYQSHHYRAALVRGGGGSSGSSGGGGSSSGGGGGGGGIGNHKRGYSVRELKEEVSGTSSADERIYPQISSNLTTFELTVFPQGSPDRPRSAPTSTTTSPRHRRHRSADGHSHLHPDSSLSHSVPDEASFVEEEKSEVPQPLKCEQNGDPQRRRDTRGRCSEVCESDRDSGQVAVPCSCAPRFFLEDIKSSRDRKCDECTESQPQEVQSQYHNHRKSSHEGRHHSRGSCCCPRNRRIPLSCPQEKRCPAWCCPFLGSYSPNRRQNGAKRSRATLPSPWHEGSSSPRTTDIVARTNMRTAGQVTTKLHKPSSVDSSSVTSSPSSSRGLWRQQSCSASIKYVSSKKHGRNIRVEQKATKVLGVVFFTFVLLWAPFFITNVSISCGADIGEEVINLVTWLGYASSMVNPFFYTFFNKTFRQTFLRIIKCQINRGRKYHF